MSSVSGSPEINPEKLEAFLGKVVTDFGAALSSQLAFIGQGLGLYKALAEGGAATPKSSPRARGRTSVTCASG
jgi:hypothetical protein